MENRSFVGESPSGNTPEDQRDNPPGPSEPRAGPSGESRDQPRERIPPLASITDDEDTEPAYINTSRYGPQDESLYAMSQDQGTDVVGNLESPPLPPPNPVLEPCDVRQNPEFQQQASRRRALRSRQIAVEGPCSLRQDSPNQPLLNEPQPYNDPNIGQQEVTDPDPRQQVATTRIGRYVSYYDRMCSMFAFQFPFHTFLLTLPLSTGILGALNLKFCYMNLYLPYVMLVVGVLGTATGLLRLYVMYFEKRVAPNTHLALPYWIGLRLAELTIWNFFTVQLYYFFKDIPIATPGHRNYCKPKFYTINKWLMYLTSVTMFGWIVVNLINLIRWLRRRVERSSN